MRIPMHDSLTNQVGLGYGKGLKEKARRLGRAQGVAEGARFELAEPFFTGLDAFPRRWFRPGSPNPLYVAPPSGVAPDSSA